MDDLVNAVRKPVAPDAVHATRKYAFIDALRGYAILLVIVCHAGVMFHELPYPLRRLTNFGWHGVQLFFLISCVTLLLSWRSDERKGQASAAAFLVRRFFRIAPAYYLAAGAYYLVMPPATGFSLVQLLTSFTFLNTWLPQWIPTTRDRWMVVPGGWSIGVEFSFYIVFPLIARRVRSVRSAVVFFLATVAAAQVLNGYLAPLLTPIYGVTPTNNFLYFWFANQAPVFAMGVLLYLAMRAVWDHPDAPVPRLLRRRARVIFVAGACACAAMVYIHLPERMPATPPLFVPQLYAASVVFAIMALALAAADHNIFVNPPIRALGQVSFSAYLVHWGVLHKLPVLFPGIFFTGAKGVAAIYYYAVTFAGTLIITFLVASLSYRLIELPMIGVGRRLADGVTRKILLRRESANALGTRKRSASF